MGHNNINERLRRQVAEAHKRIAELEKAVETSRFKAEESSQNIETIVQTLLKSPLRAIYLIDTSGTLLAMNDTGASRFGSQVSTMLGRCLYDFMPPDIAQNRRPYVEQVILTGRPFRFEDQREGKWLDNTLYPVPNASGQTTKVLIHVDDITQRKEMEEVLRRSERRYHTYVDLTSQFAWVADAGGQIVEDVPALRRFTGQTYEKIKGSGWSSAVHPDDLQRTLAVWSKAVSTGTTYEVEYRMRRHDGEYRIVLDKSVPIVSDEGQVLEWVGTCIDITEQRRMEENLRESESRFRAIADYTYDWENWLDPNCKLVWVNPAVLQFTGYTVEECMAMPDYPLPLVDRKDRDKMTDCFAEAMQGVSRNDVEFRVRCKDGSLKWTSVSWQPIYDLDGTCLGHRTSIRDISHRKRAEEKIQRLNDELQWRVVELKTANEDLQTLNYSLSHDLRSGLIAIQGFSKRLLEKYADRLDEKGQQYVRRINIASVRIAEILTDLLTFFSLNPKKIRFSPIEMDKVAREVVDELKELHTGAAIQWDIKTLPDTKGDKTMFRQVFANLLGNAVKYGKPGQTSVIEVGGLKTNRTSTMLETTASGFQPSMRIRYLKSLSGFIHLKRLREPVSDWQS